MPRRNRNVRPDPRPSQRGQAFKVEGRKGTGSRKKLQGRTSRTTWKR